MKTEENSHENNNAPSERVSSHCGTVVSHCPLVLYNHMYLFPVQFEFLQMMAPKKCSWVISQKMGYLIYSSHKAYIKQTRFHSSSISIRLVKQLTFFAKKKTTLLKRFKVSKNLSFSLLCFTIKLHILHLLNMRGENRSGWIQSFLKEQMKEKVHDNE